MTRKSLKIVHISDWHGKRYILPHADLYVVTGDMNYNFPFITTQKPNGVRERKLANVHLLGRPRANDYNDVNRFSHDWEDRFVCREMVPETEKACQDEFISLQPSLRECFGNRDAPVVMVRGNHDFTDLSQMVGGNVWEVSKDSSRSVDIEGWKIGGFRGIKYIAGEWADELHDGQIQDQVDDLPKDLDILITHMPSGGIFDIYTTGMGTIRASGSPYLREWIREKAQVSGPLTAHCFGHVHESINIGEPPWTGTVFSNAATGANTMNIYNDKLTEYLCLTELRGFNETRVI